VTGVCCSCKGSRGRHCPEEATHQKWRAYQWIPSRLVAGKARKVRPVFKFRMYCTFSHVAPVVLSVPASLLASKFIIFASYQSLAYGRPSVGSCYVSPSACPDRPRAFSSRPSGLTVTAVVLRFSLRAIYILPSQLPTFLRVRLCTSPADCDMLADCLRLSVRACHDVTTADLRLPILFSSLVLSNLSLCQYFTIDCCETAH
jgi:hypothetical protein